MLLLELAGHLPAAGHAFNTILFIIRFCVVMIGAGALVHEVKETMAAGNA